MGQREHYVKTAQKYLGCRKGDARHRLVIDLCNAVSPRPYGKMSYTSPWCAAFVTGIALEAGLTDFPSAISCKKMIASAIKLGIWMENDFYVPKPGELIMYYWGDGKDYATTDCTHDPNHVGIVTKVEGAMMTVIEGNKGNASECGYRTLQINGRYIRGFVRTKFADETKAGASVTIPIVTKLLKKGSTGQQVKYLQMRLNTKGNYALDIDGDFGPKTEAALKDYQKKEKLEVNGTTDGLTRAALNR